MVIPYQLVLIMPQLTIDRGRTVKYGQGRQIVKGTAIWKDRIFWGGRLWVPCALVLNEEGK